MPENATHVWDIWIADVGATSISFARGRANATDTMQSTYMVRRRFALTSSFRNMPECGTI